MGLSWYWKKSKHIPFYYFVLSYTIIYNTCRNGKILLAGNRYIIVAEHILLAFILCSMANPRLCCWLLHAPFMVRNITECLNASPLTSVRINSTVELMALIFLALIFSSSLKAAKLTDSKQMQWDYHPLAGSAVTQEKRCTKHSKVQARISNESWASQLPWQFPSLPSRLHTAEDEGAVQTEHMFCSSVDNKQ